MSWDVSKPSSSYMTKPTTSETSSGKQSSQGAQNTSASPFDLTGPKSAGDEFVKSKRASVEDHKAKYRQELEQRIGVKQQQQTQLTQVRNTLKKRMDEIKAERSRISDPNWDKKKLTDLSAEESRLKSEDRLAYFAMDNNYGSIISTTLDQGESLG